MINTSIYLVVVTTSWLSWIASSSKEYFYTCMDELSRETGLTSIVIPSEQDPTTRYMKYGGGESKMFHIYIYSVVVVISWLTKDTDSRVMSKTQR